jgi:L-arabinose isomerase
LYNHGIHGVQDMCNVLKRNGKGYFIEAGHWEKSDVLERVVSDVNAVKIAAYMKSARVGRIGEPFTGMGDFDVPPDVLRSTIGINTIVFDFNTSKDLFLQLDPTEIDAEVTSNLNNFLADGVDADIHRQAAATCLSVRKWLEKEKLTAFTVNFMAIDSTSGLNCMPFLEASKAMARGIGYAGEGDVLTAALVGALLSVYSETSFTEMFCPDWKNNSIYVSHMGEMNIALSADRPVLTVKEDLSPERQPS